MGRRNEKVAIWLRENPGASFKQFYVESVLESLAKKKEHASLGPKLKAGAIEKARHAFEELVRQGIEPGDTVIDYGCGTLRLGVFFIEFLEPDRYIGLDIDDRILAYGRQSVPDELVAVKCPIFDLISPESLARAAAKQPNWVVSKGVVQHVPPEELNDYFGKLACLIGAGTTCLVSGKFRTKTEQISSKTWIYDFAHLKDIAALHGLECDKVKYWMRLRPLNAADRVFHAQTP
jgi:cyclopropane fatty-acyl-phospholipid synthase-like methyltransferase